MSAIDPDASVPLLRLNAREGFVEYASAFSSGDSARSSWARTYCPGYGATSVMSRGDDREDILLDDEDRKRFLSTLGWEESDLQTRRKGDEQPIILARRLRQETTMSLEWIPQRLRMGSWTYVFNLLNGPPRSTTLCK